jgi:hypothetical protein
MEASGQTRRARGTLRVAAVLLVAIAVAIAVWLLVRNGNDDSSATTTTTTSAPPAPTARSIARASRQALVRLSRVRGRPIYWAGPERNMKLELTRTAGGRIYLRYLPLNVKIGDRRGRYLIVGTYPVSNAYRAIQKAAREPGGHRLALRRGVLGVYNDSSPTNVYFATRGSNFQVEVYDPNPRRALALVRSGRILPIRLKSTGS